MELLDNVCHMESCFGLFRDSVSVGAKTPFWMHLMVLLGEEAQVKVQYDLFGDSANIHV